jgi:hypothetical protein
VEDAAGMGTSTKSPNPSGSSAGRGWDEMDPDAYALTCADGWGEMGELDVGSVVEDRSRNPGAASGRRGEVGEEMVGAEQVMRQKAACQVSIRSATFLKPLYSELVPMRAPRDDESLAKGCRPERARAKPVDRTELTLGVVLLVESQALAPCLPRLVRRDQTPKRTRDLG